MGFYGTDRLLPSCLQAFPLLKVDLQCSGGPGPSHYDPSRTPPDVSRLTSRHRRACCVEVVLEACSEGDTFLA